VHFPPTPSRSHHDKTIIFSGHEVALGGCPGKGAQSVSPGKTSLGDSGRSPRTGKSGQAKGRFAQAVRKQPRLRTL